jgi:DNA integrity scanning protein DisA with diadenylate cyclase activity
MAHCELVLPDPKWETVPSKASAVVYSLSYVLYSAAAIFSGGMNIFLLVCYSIVIVLTPLMLLMGAKWVSTLRNKGTAIVLLVIGAVFVAELATMILAFFGVREVFLRRDKMKESEKEDDREI